MLIQKQASPGVRTHPWISFWLDLARLLPTHLVLLGECSAKIEHVVRTPLASSLARELSTLYVSKGVNATAPIEGNTLTEEQVELRLRGELDLPPSRSTWAGRSTIFAEHASGSLRESRMRIATASAKRRFVS